MNEQIEQIEQKPKNKRGGARPNSGPKEGAKYAKTLEKEEAAAYLRRRIEAEQEGLATALIKKALAGDIGALKETNERSMGKVKDNHDVFIRAVVEVSKEIVEKRNVLAQDAV